MVRDKLESCGVLDPDSTAMANVGKVRDELDRCVAACLLGAPCEEIKLAFCDEHDEELELNRCAIVCDTRISRDIQDGFECDDGERIPYGYVCDLYPSCSGGEDEADCGTFTCDDGRVIPSAAIQCDATYHCIDGTDEMGCAFACHRPLDLFTCANKIRIPAEKACDGSEDCTDGSDEEESFCGPPFVCDNGSVTLEPSLVCDEVRDCGDGTDEENCD
jgi:hypothetical protein